MATLRRKANGIFYADFRSAGRRRRRSLQTDDPAVAQARFDRFAASMATAGPGQSLIEIGQWHSQIYHAGSAQSTREGCDMVWRTFLAWAAGSRRTCRTLEDLDNAAVLDYRKWLLGRYSPGSVRQHLRVLKSGVRAAAENLSLASSVTKWPTVPVERTEIQALTIEQLQAVLNSARDQWPRCFPILLYLASSGVRIGDAVRLRHEDIDPDASVYVVRIQKARGKLSRKPLTPAILEVLRLSPTSTGWVFPSTTDPQSHVSISSVQKVCKRVAKKTGIRVTPHVFRHTYASQLARSGAPPKVVQELLDHANIAVTMAVYSHLFPGDTAKYAQGWSTRLLSVDGE